MTTQTAPVVILERAFPIHAKKAPKGTTGVVFTFNLECDVVAGHVHGAAGRLLGDAAVVGETCVVVRWKDGGELPRTLRLEHRSSPALVLRSQWLNADNEKAVLAECRVGLRAGGRYVQRRRLIAGVAAGEVRDLAVAMCEFDAMTDPDELESKKRRADALRVRELTEYLVFRAVQRAAWASIGREFEPDDGQDRRMHEAAVHVEALFRSALLKAFPRGPAPKPGRGRPAVSSKYPLDRRRFEKAFARFVAGELAMPALCGAANVPAALASHGQPDGPKFFCFAEAALLFLRLGLHAPFWRMVLPSFVCGAQFFAANYWDRCARRLSSYSWNCGATRTPSAAILAQLDHMEGSLDPSRLARRFGEVLEVALRDEPSLGRPMPAAREFTQLPAEDRNKVNQKESKKEKQKESKKESRQ